jgi:hypothetical protein
MNILEKLFGKPDEPIKIVEKPKVIDFESKLYYIIDSFGEGDTYNSPHVYKYKSIIFTMGDWYEICVNDIVVYKTDTAIYKNKRYKIHNNDNNNDSYWKNDYISSQCKDKIIKLVDELYPKALAKERSDRIELLRSSQDKVISGCNEISKGLCKSSCIGVVLPFDDTATPYYVCGKNGNKLESCNGVVYRDPHNGIIEKPSWCPNNE